MSKALLRNGCLTQRRRCPCGDDQCYIRLDDHEGEIITESVIHLESKVIQEAQTSACETVVVDIPYVGQIFRTDEEAQEYYTNFARKNGFAIRRERSKGNSSHPLGVYKREFVCHRAGISQPRKTAELKRQRNKKSSRCKCLALMIVKKNVSKGVSRWIVVHFSNDHNHDLLDSEEVRNLPAYRNIPPLMRERILLLAKAGYTANLIMRALEMEKGVNRGQLSFTERDLRNFLQNSKNINQENEGSELINACKAMKDKNPDFRYEFTRDMNGRLENISWSYPDAVHAYRLFGDSVIFDITYHLYAYSRPVGVWFGADNYGNIIFFGCVLLQDESPASFRWALQSFVRMMDGKFPETILTDLDIELRDAVMSVMPNTKHAFGIWYIMPKLSSWFSAFLGSQYETFLSEFEMVYNLETESDFVHQWSQMINEYGLGSDKHIAILSLYGSYWALSHLRGWFFGRLLTNNISMSMKSFFKVFLDSQVRLKDFVEQVATAIEYQNQAGEEATMRQNYQNIKMKTCTPMEEQAYSILTPYAFDMFQNELVSSTQLAVFESQGDTCLVRHYMKADGGHIVQCFPSEELIHCSCKEFESSGILCRHALRVLALKNCFVLPDKYLLPRWRRENSLFPKSSGYRYRSQVLRSLASLIIQESCLTKERFDYAQRHMSKLLAHVRDMSTVDEAATNTQLPSTYDLAPDPTPGRSRGRPRKVRGTGEMLKDTQELDQIQLFLGKEELSETSEFLELPKSSEPQELFSTA